ncbi:hypothetical protein Tco_0087188 [Tanacetum coccineum]
MCMSALTVSTAESKNIKEAMDDFAWIEAMRGKANSFNSLDRLQDWNNRRANAIWQEPKGYALEEGIDFEESFAPVAHSGS